MAFFFSPCYSHSIISTYQSNLFYLIKLVYSFHFITLSTISNICISGSPEAFGNQWDSLTRRLGFGRKGTAKRTRPEPREYGSTMSQVSDTHRKGYQSTVLCSWMVKDHQTRSLGIRLSSFPTHQLLSHPFPHQRTAQSWLFRSVLLPAFPQMRLWTNKYSLADFSYSV